MSYKQLRQPNLKVVGVAAAAVEVGLVASAVINVLVIYQLFIGDK